MGVTNDPGIATPIWELHMGKDFDKQDGAHLDPRLMQERHREWLKEAFRVLIPGRIAKIFGATRTFHRLARAMEEVGFVLEPGRSIEAWVYGCLSEDSEILTESGWKPGLDVQVGEQVACWEPCEAGGKMSFSPAQQVTKAPYKGDMIHLWNTNKGYQTDQVLTPNHRVYYQDERNRWHVVEARELRCLCLNGLPRLYLPLYDDNGFYRAYLHARIWPEKYDGQVWCVQVPTGAFIARRKGLAFVTGNSGFPKSLDIAKGLDSRAGVNTSDPNWKPVTPEAKRWSGYGTALKPAWEPFLVGRKPE
jgi:hypothetical protein